jgi:DNA-binding MarR family transcriptional regulator
MQELYAALRAFIAGAENGTSLQECAAHIGRATSTTNQMLAPLIAAGEIVRVLAPFDGRYTVICLPAVGKRVAEEYRQAVAQRKAVEWQKKLARQNARRHAIRAGKPKPTFVSESKRSEKRRRELEVLRMVEAFEAPVVQRIVPAHLAEPLRPRGPSCVWELAA